MAFSPSLFAQEAAIGVSQSSNSSLGNVSISLSGSVLSVFGAKGEMLQIYNVTGVQVMNVRIDSEDKRVELALPHGCYIVKVGKFVRKIAVR